MKSVVRAGMIARAGFLLGLITVSSVAAQPGTNAEAVRRELDNGFTILVREDPLAPVVALSLLVRMGSRWERAENAGISNFVHAVMVKGTTRRSGRDLAEAVAALGGKITAAGDVDYSGINATALSRFWRELLALTAELALEPAFAERDVDAERDWLLSRVERRRDAPSSRAFDDFYATLYRDHPYGLPTLGTRESLLRIDRPALVAHYRAFYRPERMVLAVSGEVRASDIFQEARRLFGGLRRGRDIAEPALGPPQPTGHRLVIEHPAQQAQILAGVLAPPLDHPDHAAVKILSTVLGGGMAGRLFAELRDRRGLAYTANAVYEPVREPAALILYLGTAPDNVAAAEAALVAEIERVRTQPVSADELRRAKGYLLGNYTMDRRTNARRAWYLALYEIEGVGADFPDRYRRAVMAVTVEGVLRVARSYLTPLTLVVLRPPAPR